MKTRMIIVDEVESSFDQELRHGYGAAEERGDLAGAVPNPKTQYKVVDQLRGESKKKWEEKFGDC